MCVDGLMVVQQRKDKVSGSADLQTWSWLILSIGAILASLLGGFLTEYNAEHWCFILKAMTGFCVAFFALFMNREIEHENVEVIKASVCNRFKQNFKTMCYGFK